MSHRKHWILVGEEISDKSEVISGCPQSTVLWPILAVVFLSDVDKNVQNLIQMFCDDTRVLGPVSSEEDVEKLQDDLETIYLWAKENNMTFNDKKFELLRYGSNQTLKENTFYLSSDEEVIEEKDNLRDLGLQMNNSATFSDHISRVVSKVQQRSGWVFRTFTCRSPFFMKTMWRQIIQPHIDYCSQIYQPTAGEELSKLENLQKHFTSRVKVDKSLDYWERLQVLQLSSIQRRFERYRIIYIWKILENLVPNCNILSTQNLRLGRLVVIPQMKRNIPTNIKKIRESSFQVHGGKLFNALPKELRDAKFTSVEEFKAELDAFLANVPDQPNIPGVHYTLVEFV